NPLAPILTALQLMKMREAQAHEPERRIIERQVRHLVSLVDDLLDIARVTQGKLALRTERIELAEAIAKAVEQTAPLLEQRRHRLRVEVPAQGLAVDGDPERLGQVFGNLLANAAKYTDPGGEIVVRARLEGERVIASVRDNG